MPHPQGGIWRPTTHRLPVAGDTARVDGVVRHALEHANGQPETPSPWVRLPHPQVVCRCGRLLHEHRIDTTAMGTDDKTCRGFHARELRWHETRTVRQPVPDA